MKIVWLCICVLLGTQLYAQGGSIEGRVYGLETNQRLADAKLILQKENVYCQRTKK